MTLLNKKNLCLLICLLIISGCKKTSPQKAEVLPEASPVSLPYTRILEGPVKDYEVMRAGAPRGNEYYISTTQLDSNGLEIENKMGRSAGGKYKPWILIRNIKTKKGVGVYIGYSGNWKISIKGEGENTNLYASTIPQSLEPIVFIDDLPLPGALVAEFSGDWDNGAQQMVRYIRKNLTRKIDDDWPWVIFNTWCEYDYKIDEEHLLKTIPLAAKMGCELLVIDAGWYGSQKDVKWETALGDWVVNQQRLPKGIEPIAEEARKNGMKFGMWIEVECAHPASPIGREHPDWFLRHDGKLLSDRAVLNFGNPEVLAWAIEQVDRLIDTYKLDYVKMDFNATPPIDNENLTSENDPLYLHYKGLVKLWQHMHEKYPNLPIENCASGSLRHDLMTEAFTDTSWITDNVTHPVDISLNYGATYICPPERCSTWLVGPEATDAIDLQACFHIRMLGQMGISDDITKWTEEAFNMGIESVAEYKKLRPIIRNSDVYHLTKQTVPRAPDSIQAAQYLEREKDISLVYVFQGGANEMQTVLKLKGLKDNQLYKVEKPESFGAVEKLKGQQLMQGLEIKFPTKGSSAIIKITPVL